MILSHELKLIFLKPRKVAGTSFEIALSKFAGPDDIITPIAPPDELARRRLGFRTAQRYRKRPLDLLPPTLSDLRGLKKGRAPRRFYNHMPAAELKAKIPVRVWRDYAKISIVRNPWDRAVSLYYWRNRNGEETPFEEWLSARPAAIRANHGQYMIDGAPVIDHFIRFETFRQDVLDLEKTLPQLCGLAEAVSSIRAKSGVRPERGASTAELFAQAPKATALVAQLCRFEIERFGYRLD